MRFSMANERTALAWLRTALSVVAAGVGLTTLARERRGGGVRCRRTRDRPFHRPVEHGP